MYVTHEWLCTKLQFHPEQITSWIHVYKMYQIWNAINLASEAFRNENTRCNNLTSVDKHIQQVHSFTNIHRNKCVLVSQKYGLFCHGASQ